MLLKSSKLLLLCTVGAFAFAPATRNLPSTALGATVDKTELVPPKSTTELMKHGSETSDLYDSNVQKTYGYVVTSFSIIFRTSDPPQLTFDFTGRHRQTLPFDRQERKGMQNIRYQRQGVS